MNDNDKEQDITQEDQIAEGKRPTTKAKEILKRTAAIQFAMDYMRSPEDALLKWDLMKDFSQVYKAEYLSPIYEAAKRLGVDPEQIISQEKRTPEQQNVITEVILERYKKRISNFFATLYSDALCTLYEISEQHPDNEDEIQIDKFIEEEAAVYFFAIHDDIKATDKGKLTSEQHEELRDIFNRLTLFYEKRGEVLHKADSYFEFIEQENPEKAESIIEKISYHNFNQLQLTTDKLPATFFSLAAPPRNIIDGQISMIPLKYEGNNSKKTITLYYDYEYDEDFFSSTGISKKFDSYDFFVATIIDNFYENGNTIVSLSKFLSEMGYNENPGQKQIQKLTESLMRGAATILRIDDKEVQRAWGNTNGEFSEIFGAVFPIKMQNKRYMMNGRYADSTIKIQDYTPFRTISASLKHMTQWDKRVLSLYTGRKTERYWNILHLLLREIGWMRHDSKRRRKILYSTVYAYNQDKTAQTEKLSRDMLYQLINEVFIPTGYVTKAVEDNSTEPGVILTVKNPKLLG